MIDEAGTDPRHEWRKRAGNPRMYDTMGASQFALLVLFFGLRERHKLLEIGAGCLRAARFLIPYLDVGHYCGVEPSSEVVRLGIQHELGEEMAERKKPRFSERRDFVFDDFDESFDYGLSYSVLTHAAPWQIPKFFEGVAAVFHDDSILLATASFAQGDDEKIDDHEKWTTFSVNQYSERRIANAVSSVGLRFMRVGRVFQNWFVVCKEGNDVAVRGAEEMRKVHWGAVAPQWEDPAWKR